MTSKYAQFHRRAIDCHRRNYIQSTNRLTMHDVWTHWRENTLKWKHSKRWCLQRSARIHDRKLSILYSDSSELFQQRSFFRLNNHFVIISLQRLFCFSKRYCHEQRQHSHQDSNQRGHRDQELLDQISFFILTWFQFNRVDFRFVKGLNATTLTRITKSISKRFRELSAIRSEFQRMWSICECTLQIQHERIWELSIWRRLRDFSTKTWCLSEVEKLISCI